MAELFSFGGCGVNDPLTVFIKEINRNGIFRPTLTRLWCDKITNTLLIAL